MSETILKAWAVRSEDYETGCVVFAETRGKAHRLGVSELDEEWTSIRVKRAPEFDELAPGPVTRLDYIARGWWTICACGSQCHADTEGTVIADGEVYCSAQCQERDRAFQAGKERAA